MLLSFGAKVATSNAAGSYTISGSITATEGNLSPDPSTSSINFKNNGDGNNVSSSIQSTGSYSALVPGDTYPITNINISSSDNSVGTINFGFNPTPAIDATSGNVTQNYSLSTNIITINVVDAHGNPVPGVALSTNGTGCTTLAEISVCGTQSSMMTTTNSSGTATFTGINGFTYSPICGIATAFGATKAMSRIAEQFRPERNARGSAAGTSNRTRPEGADRPGPI